MTIALSLGDPCGIGPELVVKTWRLAISGQVDIPKIIVYGSHHAMINAGLREDEIGDPWPQKLPLVNLDSLVDSHVKPVWGQPDKRFAPLITTAIAQAVKAVETGVCRALVTLPIAKSVLYQSGFSYAGHTEYLGALSGVGADNTVMMMVSPRLIVVPATLHVSIANAIKQITLPHLSHIIRVTHKALTEIFKINRPRIAVSGLNPHAGEDRSMGDEDATIIAPAIKQMCAEDICVIGPLPADSMFHEAARQRYDAAIMMTHDQALIPFKTLSFDDGVNLTLGLPFIRTSPAHGTAFDIAGPGIAKPDSLIAALQLAHRLSS